MILTSYSHIDLRKHDVHDVAAVLRIFFRDLPEPLIPFSLYEPLLSIQRDENLTLDQRLRAIKGIIDKIPPVHSNVLNYLIKFLLDVEEYSDINKMTVKNIAIVFGPNIIKPKVETVQNALEMPLLNGIIQLFLEHAHEFWGIVKHKKTRPQSIIFVGTDLTKLARSEESISALNSVRALSRQTPGCGDEKIKRTSKTIPSRFSHYVSKSSESVKQQSPNGKMRVDRANSDLVQELLNRQIGNNEATNETDANVRRNSDTIPGLKDKIEAMQKDDSVMYTIIRKRKKKRKRV